MPRELEGALDTLHAASCTLPEALDLEQVDLEHILEEVGGQAEAKHTCRGVSSMLFHSPFLVCEPSIYVLLRDLGSLFAPDQGRGRKGVGVGRIRLVARQYVY